MNRLLTILLLAVGTAYGQINNPPTSVNIVDATATGRAVLTATNAAAAASAVGLGATNDVTLNRIATTANGSFTNPAIRIGASNTGLISVSGYLFGVSKGESVFGASPTSFTIVPPATFSTNVNVNGSLVGTGPATFATNVTVGGNLSVGSLTTTTPSTWALDATQTAAATNGVLTLPSNANVIRLTNNNAISSVTNGVLGAFYYLVNQTTNAVTISNVGGITVQGGTSLTLGVNQSATLVATGATNASVAARGDLNNVTLTGDTVLSGVNNTMPNATNAASASSLMTRDLVGQEFANPRTKMQTTYWFGLEGLGLWQLVNSGATAMANRGPKFGPSLAFYTSSKPATTAAGAGVRLGANSITGSGAWRPIDGGALTAKTHVVNYYSDAAVGNRAFAFSFAGPANTNFWAAPDSFGLFWVQQPTNSWAASTAFALHDRIAVSNVVWAVATAGTTDATAPTWTDLIGSTVTNGTAVFRNIGPHTSNNWVLAIGHTNASQVVMTNTGKSNWLRASGSGHEVLLTLRYGTNTTAPYTVYGSVADGTGQGSEVALNLATNTGSFSPQYWLRFDGTNATTGNESAGMRYFSIDAETPPLN